MGDRLGGGSYGCVWEATLLDSGISAVVKVPPHCNLHPTPHTLHQTPANRQHIPPYILQPETHTRHPTPHAAARFGHICRCQGASAPPPTPYTLHSREGQPYTLRPTLYTFHSTPWNLHPTSHTLHPTPDTTYHLRSSFLCPPPHTLQPAPTPYILHPTPRTRHHIPPYITQPATRTPHPTPNTIYHLTAHNPQPTPHTPHPTPVTIYQFTSYRPQPTPYRGTSIIRKRLTLGPYSSRISRGLGWSWGGGRFTSARYPCTPHTPRRCMTRGYQPLSRCAEPPEP